MGFFRKVSIKISLWLLIPITVFSVCVFFTTEGLQSFCIGAIVNLLTIILTVNFVDILLNKQEIYEEKNNEIKKICRAYKVLKIYIAQYTYSFNCITSPVKADEKDKMIIPSSDVFNKNFIVSDMQDLYFNACKKEAGILESAIELFDKVEKNVVKKMSDMLDSIDFKFNSEIETLLIQFIENATTNDPKGQIVSYHKAFAGGNKLSDSVSKMIKEYTGDPAEDLVTGKYSSNCFLPILSLFFSLRIQVQIVEKLICEIQKICI